MTSRGVKYWDSGAIPLIAPEILGDIILEVADIGLIVTPDAQILSVMASDKNAFFRDLTHWEGKPLQSVLSYDSVAKFEKRLAAFVAADGPVRAIELNHADSRGQWEFPVSYSFHRIAPDGTILLLGRDLRPIAEMQQQLVKAQLALERDYEIQREQDIRFRVLMDSLDDAVVFVSAQTGEITEANRAAIILMDSSRESLIGMKLVKCFDSRSQTDLLEGLVNAAKASAAEGITTELEGSGQAVKLVPTLFRAAGERVLLCRISTDGDARALPVDDLSQSMQDLYRRGPDAMVFATENGDILSANDAFLALTDTAQDLTLRGQNLTEYLQRGSVDLKVMTENAGRAGKMRMYATKVAGPYGSPRPVEISVTKLQAGPHAVFAFVARESGHADSVRSTVNPTSDESMRSVIELVGNATLKDIVAETTDVVERMCIETAVGLTMNNRVAAAEMLGLSRQSLYVKLRKFGLLSRDGNKDD